MIRDAIGLICLLLSIVTAIVMLEELMQPHDMEYLQ